jgi:hypothetical protein
MHRTSFSSSIWTIESDFDSESIPTINAENYGYGKEYINDKHYNLPPAYGDETVAALRNESTVPNSSMSSPVSPTSSIIRSSKKRKWKRICISLLVILILLAIPLITLGLLYLKQRDVNFTILPVLVNNATIELNPQGFTIPIDPEIEATNDNYFRIDLKSIHVEANHPDYGFGTIPLGIGSLYDVILHKRSTTVFSFPLEFTYNSTIDTSYFYLEQLLRNCSDTTNANLYVHVSIMVNYHVWAKSGTMNDDRDILVPCPIEPNDAKRILGIISL